MGADFVRKAAKTFEKSWDKDRVELATANLFTQQPKCAARTSRADILGNAHLAAGDVVTVQAINGGLIAMRGLSRVARFSQPSTELIEGVNASCGVAKGTIEKVHPLSGVVEISIC
jgi:hypothetical protein